MDDLIAALTIFAKYKKKQFPTMCEHDVLYVVGIRLEEISEDDRAELERLGFFWDSEVETWASSKFGSA